MRQGGPSVLYGAKEAVLRLHDMEMNYICFGRGKKPLVMIQGLNTRGIKGAGLPLAYMYRIFAKDYTVYLFDRRANLPENITVRDMAKDIASAMDMLHIANADICGVSQGVSSVIAHWIALTQAGNMKALVSDMTLKLYSDKYIRRYKLFLPLLTLWQTPKDTQRFITLAKSCLTCSTYHILEQIQCPVLVIGGAKDKIVGSEAAKELADKLQCQYILYEDLGHAVYEEAKDFNQKVYEFFKQHNNL